MGEASYKGVCHSYSPFPSPRAVFHVGFTESGGGVEFSKESVILHVASRDKSYSLGQDLHLTVTLLNTKDNGTGESI